MKTNITISVVALVFSAMLISSCFYKETQPPPSPNGRAEWRAMMRNQDASPEKVLAARESIRAQFSKEKDLNYKDAGLNKWESLASNSGAGRTRTIAVHPTDPDILYLGAASGGIWKTTDRGTTWTELDDFLPSLSVTSIIVHPTNSDTLYAATGESILAGTQAQSSPGAGIFRSINGGNTWKLAKAIDPLDLSQFYWVNKIAFDPADPSSFYATSNGTSQAFPHNSNRLFRFDDNGETKVELSGFSSESIASSVTNVVVNPGDPNHILVCTSSGLVQSYDKGSTWALTTASNNTGWLDFSNRVEVAISIDDPNKVYALCQGNGSDDGRLLLSTDKGATWIVRFDDLNIMGNQGWYNNVIWADPLDADQLIFGGIDLYRSFDSGFSFFQISDWAENDTGLSPHADHHVIVAGSDYSPSNKRIYFGNDGGIASIANLVDFGFVTWELLNNEQLGITQYYESDIYDGTIIAGSQDNGSWVSQDDGTSFYKTKGGDGGGCAVSHQDPNLIFTSVQFGKIQVSNVAFATLFDSIVGFDITDIKNSEPLDTAPFIVQMESFPNEGNRVMIGSYSLWEFEVDPVSYDSVAVSYTHLTLPTKRIG